MEENDESPIPSAPLWCPFELVGESWEDCVAEVDREFMELEAKIRADNGQV